MGSTKILVFRLKEIIYTVFFIALGILLILLLVFMFSNKKSKEVTETFGYVPGVYTASVILDSHPVNVEVIVDSNHINSVKIVDLNATTDALYPLLQPAMSDIEAQLTSQIELQPLTIRSEYKYTSTLLIEAINRALSKAKLDT